MKILIIDFYCGTDNVGGLRWKKFAKYLPSEGIEPIILTSGSSKDDTYNVFHFPFFFHFSASHGFAYGRDDSLWGRIKRFVRGNLFIPDPRRLWFCYGLAEDLCKRHNVSTVITTGPPHSVHLIGLKLKRKLGVKWITDFRDPWIPYWYKDVYLTNFASNMQYRCYHDVLSNADIVLQVEDKLVSGNNIILSNGFDAEDFETWFPQDGGLKYIGSLSDKNLLPDINYKHVHGVPHDKAIREMLGADYLIVCYPDDVIPSKIYEYMASGRTIVSIGINGKGARLIHECGAGVHLSLGLANSLAGQDTFYSFINNWSKSIKRNEDEIKKYNVKNITKELVEIIKTINQ